MALAPLLAAHAQQTTGENSSGFEPLEEVVVTAEKRQQALSDVGVSITALPAATVESFQLVDFEKYFGFVPGLSADLQGVRDNRGLGNVGVRGIEDIGFGGSRNAVGYYLNETPIVIINPRLFDLERIEVLRGPQGTLYGSSSLNGTIKIVTKQPVVNRFESDVRASAGSVESGGTNYSFDGMVNVPMGDKVALRLTGSAEELGGYVDFHELDENLQPTGYIKNDINVERFAGGRIALAIEPADNFSIIPSVNYSKRWGPSDDRFMPELGFEQRFALETPYTNENLLADVTINWNLGSMQLVSSTSYFWLKNDSLWDITDGFAFGYNPPVRVPELTELGFRDWTQELRLVSNWDKPLQFVTGVFYKDRKSKNIINVSGVGQPAWFGFPIPNNTLFTADDEGTVRESAIYFEGTYHFSPAWALVAGGRWFDFKYSRYDIFQGIEFLVENQYLSQGTENTESGFVPRVRLEYRPANDSLLYASASKGFRPGGGNFPLPPTPGCQSALTAVFGKPVEPMEYKSDSLWSYELGGKFSWLNNHLAINTALFYIDWRDTQVPVSLNEGTGLCTFSGPTVNLGAVHSKGGELELQAAPFKGLVLSVGVSYIDAAVAEQMSYPGATFIIAAAGEPMIDVPKWSGSAMVDYSFPLTTSVGAYVRADYRYQGARNAEFGSTLVTKDAYEITDLRLGAQFHGGWQTEAYAENLFNAKPSLLGTPWSTTFGPYGVDRTLRPRTIGVSVSKSFR
jgi:outer membrane receptor protein involved in Fe transport